MPPLREVLVSLESVSPARFAFSFDKVGLQVGDPNQNVSKAVVTLDRSIAAVAFAKRAGAQLVLAHHPLIFRPIESVDTRSHVGRTILELIKNDISFVAAHTNWDSAIGGINDTLASLLDLEGVAAFGTAAEVSQLKMVVFAPAKDVEAIVDAASDAGAGVIGHYGRCNFAGEGTGSYIENGQERCDVDEVRLEMILPAIRAKAVESAVRAMHSYIEPAIDFNMLRPWAEQPAGRVGKCRETTLSELARVVDQKLETRCLAWGDSNKRIKKIAVVGGAADDEWRDAQRAGADVLITGEVKQHNALEASESGMALISAGHYATEHPGCEALRQRMASVLPEIEWTLFTPEPGQSGRPISM